MVACSNTATLAQQFSRDAQFIMDEPNYARLFPESIISGFATMSQELGAERGSVTVDHGNFC